MISSTLRVPKQQRRISAVSIPTILIIEDNLADVFLFRHAFDELGEPYLLEVLTDGEGALAFVAEHRSGARKPEPCVILLDLHLPKYNGLEVLAAIRVEPPLSHIHVVVLTSRASPEEEIKVMQLGGICRIKPPNLAGIKKLAIELMDICKGRIVRIASSA
jgi:CheY-like chemotaxis protein